MSLCCIIYMLYRYLTYKGGIIEAVDVFMLYHIHVISVSDIQRRHYRSIIEAVDVFMLYHIHVISVSDIQRPRYRSSWCLYVVSYTCYIGIWHTKDICIQSGIIEAVDVFMLYHIHVISISDIQRRHYRSSWCLYVVSYTCYIDIWHTKAAL